MKIILKYYKKNGNFVVKINKFFFLKKNLKKKICLLKISLLSYNYIILSKILRQFGLIKPLINKKEFY